MICLKIKFNGNSAVFTEKLDELQTNVKLQQKMQYRDQKGQEVPLKNQDNLFK